MRERNDRVYFPLELRQLFAGRVDRRQVTNPRPAVGASIVRPINPSRMVRPPALIGTTAERTVP